MASKRAEAAELYEGMVADMERTRAGGHQVAALLLKLSEVSTPSVSLHSAIFITLSEWAPQRAHHGGREFEPLLDAVGACM